MKQMLRRCPSQTNISKRIEKSKIRGHLLDHGERHRQVYISQLKESTSDPDN